MSQLLFHDPFSSRAGPRPPSLFPALTEGSGAIPSLEVHTAQGGPSARLPAQSSIASSKLKRQTFGRRALVLFPEDLGNKFT